MASEYQSDLPYLTDDLSSAESSDESSDESSETYDDNNCDIISDLTDDCFLEDESFDEYEIINFDDTCKDSYDEICRKRKILRENAESLKLHLPKKVKYFSDKLSNQKITKWLDSYSTLSPDEKIKMHRWIYTHPRHFVANLNKNDPLYNILSESPYIFPSIF
jgi:hypothetical protein